MILLIRLLLLFCLLVPGFAYGVTYYIDFSTGSDTNAGTSTSTAWKTIPGTRTANESTWQSTDWGSGTINSTNKVPAGTIFRIKGGTTHSSSNGGSIYITSTYYNNGSAGNEIIFQPDTVWQVGAVTIDGAGVTTDNEVALVVIKLNYIKWDGISTDGIVIQNSTYDGVRVSNSVDHVTLQYIKLYQNGTSRGPTTGSSVGGIVLHTSTNTNISYCNFDGNGNYLNGLFVGETNVAATDVMVSNCNAYNHAGSDDYDQGIGFKALNSQITFTNCTSYSNDKGFDLGENSGNNRDILYKVINSYAYNNTEAGINFNGVGAGTYTGSINFYLINSIIRDNGIAGSKIYAGPFTTYIIHNVFDNNGSGDTDGYNLQITPDSTTDENTIVGYIYNNIFYKPQGLQWRIGYIGDTTSGCDTNLTLYSDYNSYTQRASENFGAWAYNAANCRVTGVTYSFAYGANGPGHGSGTWYTEEGEPGNGTGHYHCDAHSKGTGATDTTLPPFTDVTNHVYTLTTHYVGTNLSSQPWYISEMGIDRSGISRISWDIGAYEYVGTRISFTGGSQSLIIGGGSLSISW